MSENAQERTERADGVLLLTMVEAARVLSIGRTTMYELVGAGEIEVVHIGRSARVPVAALEEFVEPSAPRRDYRSVDNECGPGQAGT